MGTENPKSIIDVRTPEEYREGHIEGAVNIPVDGLAGRMDEIKKLPEPIIAYCGSGKRSAMAIETMKQHGMAGIVNGGGIDDMRKRGY